MKTKVFLSTFVVTYCVSFCLAQIPDVNIPGPESFDEAKISFEQNATDGDVEVVFEIKGGDDGLNKLAVVSPDNRIVIDFAAPDNSTMGIRQFRFESPEPGDVDALKKAYPEGVYKLNGTTEAGEKFYSESFLSHKLPSTVSFLHPEEEEEDVNSQNLVITWSPVTTIVAYILELDQDELGVNILAKLPSSETSFMVPERFLQAGTEYTLSIGTINKDGNSSFVETSFTTAVSK